MGKTSTNQIDDDARFDKVYSDPRFIKAPNKVKKVEVDNRFKSMFTDKTFNQVAKVDKYGRKINKQDTYALQNYYQGEKEGSKFYDEQGKF